MPMQTGPDFGKEWDVIVVGAGPAGLSAALILGRCQRRVLLCDRGTPRSWASKAMHGFLSRDGIPPATFTDLARGELSAYPTVQCRAVEVKRAAPDGTGFLIHAGEDVVRARKLLIATGLQDELPDVEGFAQLFGSTVFQCPYCDGWEFRGRPIGVYGKGRRGLEMARALTAWTKDIVLCTDGAARLSHEQREQLQHNGIRLIEQKICRLEDDAGRLTAILFSDGSRVSRDAIFFDGPSRGQSDLTDQLGCRYNRAGGVLCGKYEATSVPGVYVAGNIIRNVQLSIVAAAEGASAAFGINRALTREDFERRATGRQHVEHTAPELRGGGS
jgi:thioredoxin reductase